MTNLHEDRCEKNDQPGNLADFFSIYQDWRFEWLDVADLIGNRRPDTRIPDGG